MKKCMENNSGNIFDDRLRQMLSNAEEMPPERVWNGIVASMEAGTDGVAKRSRVRALWLSGLGLVSVAAAVAAFFLPIIGLIIAQIFKHHRYYRNYKSLKKGGVIGLIVRLVIIVIFVLLLVLAVI